MGDGAAHNFFFAPAQFARRDQEWGAGEIMRRAQAEATRMALEMKGRLKVRRVTGAVAVAASFSRLVAGEVQRDEGMIATVAA